LELAAADAGRGVSRPRFNRVVPASPVVPLALFTCCAKVRYSGSMDVLSLLSEVVTVASDCHAPCNTPLATSLLLESEVVETCNARWFLT